MPDELVLVTGATGFVATNIIKLLLENGYRVRGTVRDKNNEKKNKPVLDLHPNTKEKLELVNADLTKPDGWKEAVAGCPYILHVASPFPANDPEDENEVIRPAVDGTMHVLKAAAEVGGVKRIVLTSSMVAIYRNGTTANGREYSEADWTDTDAHGISPYEKSKTFAENAAWEFVQGLQGPNKFELAVINPGFVLGPMLTDTEGTSANVVKQILTKQLPLLPKLCVPFVDVRDVAQAHVKAMTTSDAAGKRFCLVSAVGWFKEMAMPLDKEFKSQGYKVPTHEAPNFVIWLGSCFDKGMKSIYPQVGISYTVNNDKMKTILGISNPIPVEKSVVDLAYSLIERGLVKKTSKYTGQQAAQ